MWTACARRKRSSGNAAISTPTARLFFGARFQPFPRPSHPGCLTARNRARTSHAPTYRNACAVAEYTPPATLRVGVARLRHKANCFRARVKRRSCRTMVRDPPGCNHALRPSCSRVLLPTCPRSDVVAMRRPHGRQSLPDRFPLPASSCRRHRRLRRPRLFRRARVQRQPRVGHLPCVTRRPQENRAEAQAGQRAFRWLRCCGERARGRWG